MNRVLRKLLLFKLLLLLLPVLAQDGSPFQDFGNQGLTLKNFGETSLVISSVNQGTSGRIAVLTTEYPVLIATIGFIQVYNEDGSTDTSFGDNGYLIIANDTGIPIDNIRVLDDNTILYQYGDSVIKLLPNGDRDLSFGDNGSINTSSGSTSVLNYALHEDGSIYTSGIIFSTNRDYFIKKYTSNGLVDTTFGDQGHAEFPLNPFLFFYKKPIKFLDNGAILINYSTKENTNSDILNKVVRISQNGQLDTSFGNNGSIEIYFQGLRNTAIHVFNTGSFLLSFVSYDSENELFIRKILKFIPNGAQDINFADNGILDGYSVAFIQENQRFITTSDTPDWEGGVIPVLKRHFSNGAFDASFVFQYNYSELNGYIISPTPNGKILLAGSDVWYNGPEINLLVAQYNNSPLGIDEHTNNSPLIFPNPSKNIFFITCDCELQNKRYTITDISGKIIKQGLFIHSEIMLNLSEIQRGVYFLTIENNTLKLLKI
jgi:uncharacterized delta-60 repeat protein